MEDNATQPEEEIAEVEESAIGPAPEKVEKAIQVAQDIAEKMGMPAAISARDEDTKIVLVIEEAEASTAVADTLGKAHPPAVPSLQFLLNKIVNRFPEGRKHIVVEAPTVQRRPRVARDGDGRSRTERPFEVDPDLDPSMVALGKLLAEKAVQTQRVLTVHPMLAGDRRAIHQTVMGIEGVHTVSEGDGLYRRMHVVPDSIQPAPGRKRRRRRRRRRGEGEEGSGLPEGAAVAEESTDSAGDAAAAEAAMAAPSEEKPAET